MFEDDESQDLFYLNRQEMYQFRDQFIFPMLQQRAQNAQGIQGKFKFKKKIIIYFDILVSLACSPSGQLSQNAQIGQKATPAFT